MTETQSPEDLFGQPQRDTPEQSTYSFDGKPDRWNRYRLPDPVTGKPGGYTRATTFAGALADNYTLHQWQQRMVGKGLSMRPSLLATFAAHDVTADREILNNAAEEAKTAAGAREGANLGTAVHALAARVDRGEITVEEIPEPWRHDVAAGLSVLADFGLEAVPEYVERIVLNTRWSVAGTFDRLVRVTREIDLRLDGEIVTLHPGDLVDLDWKTQNSKSIGYAWMEIAIQQTVYATAEFMWSHRLGYYEPMPAELRRDVALILHCPAGEQKAAIHAINVKKGSILADLCATIREARKAKGLSAPVAVADVAPSGEVTSGAPTFEDRIEAATTITGLSKIRKDALTAKAWTSRVERLALAKRDAILADVAGSVSDA